MALVGQALRYRMPARRRLGSLAALASRQGIPEGSLARALTLLPGRPRPDLDRLLGEVAEAWPSLRRPLAALPEDCPHLTALALSRSAALTIFAFGSGPRPLLVLKVPAPGDPRADREADALADAAPAKVAPMSLGRVGDARVQEALVGDPLAVEPLTPERARVLRWSRRFTALGAAFAELASVTAKGEHPRELDERLSAAAGYNGLDHRTRVLVTAAAKDLARLPVAVLRHGDASAQNCLFRGQRFVGLVDWESANPAGVAGSDVWNTALAYLDHGVGLVRWSEELMLETFRAAWSNSGFFEGARAAARAAAEAAGVPDSHLDALDVGVFAGRLGRRLREPGVFATGPEINARMVEIVCDN